MSVSWYPSRISAHTTADMKNSELELNRNAKQGLKYRCVSPESPVLCIINMEFVVTMITACSFSSAWQSARGSLIAIRSLDTIGLEPVDQNFP